MATDRHVQYFRDLFHPTGLSQDRARSFRIGRANAWHDVQCGVFHHARNAECLRPAETGRAKELPGGTAVVIDVLRSTTTIVHALAAGPGKWSPAPRSRRPARSPASSHRARSCWGANGAGWRCRASIWATRRKTTRPIDSAARRSSSPRPTGRGRWSMPERRRGFSWGPS